MVFRPRLWVLIGITVGAAIVLVLLFLCFSRRRRRRWREDLAANLTSAPTIVFHSFASAFHIQYPHHGSPTK